MDNGKTLSVDNIARYIKSVYVNAKFETHSDISVYLGIYTDITQYFYNKKLSMPRKPYERTRISGACAFCNEGTRDSWVSNIHLISFKKLYPNIICKLMNSGELEFITKELGELYYFMVTNLDELSEHKDVNYNISTRSVFNILINYMFGIIANRENIITDTNIRNIIVDYTRPILDSFRGDDNIIHVDVDEIYVKELSDDLMEKINSLGLEYDIHKVYKGYFIQVMKYIALRDDVGIKLRGISYNQPTSRRRRSKPSRCTKIIDEAKIHERVLKIERIKKKIKVEH